MKGQTDKSYKISKIDITWENFRRTSQNLIKYIWILKSVKILDIVNLRYFIRYIDTFKL